MGDQLRDVIGLVADALHVGDHLQRGGDLPQVAGHRLLVQQKAQAQVLNVPLLAVDVTLQPRHLSGQGRVALRQGLGRHGDGLLTQSAHLDQLPVELGQLLVKLASHHPNLPVM